MAKENLSIFFALTHTHLSFFDCYSFLFLHSSQNSSPLHFMRLPVCVYIYIPNPSPVCFTYICMSLFSPNSIRNRKPRPCPYNWAYTVWAGLSCFIRTPQQSLLVTRHGKTGGSGRGGAGGFGSSHESNGSRVKTGHFKRVEIGFGSIGLWVESGWPVFFTWNFLFFL